MYVYAVMGDDGRTEWLCSLWFSAEAAQAEADRLGEAFPQYVYRVDKVTVQGFRT